LLLPIIPTLLTAFIQVALKYPTFIRVGFTHTHTHTHTRVHQTGIFLLVAMGTTNFLGRGFPTIVQQMKRNTEAPLEKLKHDVKVHVSIQQILFTFHAKYADISACKKVSLFSSTTDEIGRQDRR
jgi:hypothetical protein